MRNGSIVAQINGFSSTNWWYCVTPSWTLFKNIHVAIYCRWVRQRSGQNVLLDRDDSSRFGNDDLSFLKYSFHRFFNCPNSLSCCSITWMLPLPLDILEAISSNLLAALKTWWRMIWWWERATMLFTFHIILKYFVMIHFNILSPVQKLFAFYFIFLSAAKTIDTALAIRSWWHGRSDGGNCDVSTTQRNIARNNTAEVVCENFEMPHLFWKLISTGFFSTRTVCLFHFIIRSYGIIISFFF